MFGLQLQACLEETVFFMLNVTYATSYFRTDKVITEKNSQWSS